MLEQRFLLETSLFLLIAVPSSIFDIKKFRIPLFYVLFGAAVFIALEIFVALSGNFNSFAMCKNKTIAVLSSFLIFFTARIFSGDGLGKGDIVFGCFSALYSGFYENLIAVAFSALSGILFYLVQKVAQNHRADKSVLCPVFAIPFVPFITFGTLLAKFMQFL